MAPRSAFRTASAGAMRPHQAVVSVDVGLVPGHVPGLVTPRQHAPNGGARARRVRTALVDDAPMADREPGRQSAA